MIQLTSKCGYPVLVNPQQVCEVCICSLSEKCDFESPEKVEDCGLGLKLTYVCGKTRVVTECISDWEELTKGIK